MHKSSITLRQAQDDPRALVMLIPRTQEKHWASKSVLPILNYFLVFLSIFFASLSMQAQSKVEVKSQTEFAIETKGGKETDIKRHYQEFDQRGNLIIEIDYDSEGKLKEETRYEYNQKNEKIKETHFAENGKIDEISTYEYDAKGNRISKTVTDENGKLKSKKKYVYEYY